MNPFHESILILFQVLYQNYQCFLEKERKYAETFEQLSIVVTSMHQMLNVLRSNSRQGCF